MHPPLSLHMHPGCEAQIEALHKCHADNKLKKFVGACNEVRREMDKCLQLEFEVVRQANYDKAHAARQRWEKERDEIRAFRAAKEAQSSAAN